MRAPPDLRCSSGADMIAAWSMAGRTLAALASVCVFCVKRLLLRSSTYTDGSRAEVQLGISLQMAKTKPGHDGGTGPRPMTGAHRGTPSRVTMGHRHDRWRGSPRRRGNIEGDQDGAEEGSRRLPIVARVWVHLQYYLLSLTDLVSVSRGPSCAHRTPDLALRTVPYEAPAYAINDAMLGIVMENVCQISGPGLARLRTETRRRPRSGGKKIRTCGRPMRVRDSSQGGSGHYTARDDGPQGQDGPRACSAPSFARLEQVRTIKTARSG